jgi:hypothetical protein
VTALDWLARALDLFALTVARAAMSRMSCVELHDVAHADLHRPDGGVIFGHVAEELHRREWALVGGGTVSR